MKLFSKISARALQAVSIRYPFNLFSVNLHTYVRRKDTTLFPHKPKLDYSLIKEAGDAIYMFHEMVHMSPQPSVVEFTKLLNVVVKMKQYSIALFLFDEMRQLGVPFDDYPMSTAINCYCHLNRVDIGFSILGLFFKCGH
ncbi:hypothetical protein RD792_017410 [Penstemon davidsonii]|uniref:Pentatricopeptide repeat-containing protein n=1 Tax=Penstemon davidsonii TaxID=160366 RepID=A0ABR0CNS6_9LAMI|nr:hypothetical protein RD792_017410 [Penstemon davidsonii]